MLLKCSQITQLAYLQTMWHEPSFVINLLVTAIYITLLHTTWWLCWLQLDRTLTIQRFKFCISSSRRP